MQIEHINNLENRPFPKPKVILNTEETFKIPDDLTKAGAMRLIARALHLLGVSRTGIEVFRLLADMTENKAWHDKSKKAVNWRKQSELSNDVKITNRHFRRIEAQLVKMGVICKDTGLNGWRGRSYSGNQVDGLSLEPAIANIKVFKSIIEFKEEKIAVEVALINKIKDCKKTLRHYNSVYGFSEADFALIKAPLPRNQNLIRISNHLEALKNVVTKMEAGGVKK